MAVVTVKSTQITNRDAVPRVAIDARVQGAASKHARGVAAIANGDSIGSKYILCSVPSNALLISARLTAPDIGTTTAADFGLYRSTADGGAVVDADFFKAAVVLNAGAITKAEQLFGNIVTIANSEKPLWQQLGLSADPGINYDVVLTLTAAADAAGSVLGEIDFTQ